MSQIYCIFRQVSTSTSKVALHVHAMLIKALHPSLQDSDSCFSDSCLVAVSDLFSFQFSCSEEEEAAP